MVINKNQKVYPHELATWKILPAVKAELARKLNEDGMSVEEIANLLEATKSSIYQYLRGDRGNQFDIPVDVDPMFHALIGMLKEDGSDDVLFFGVTQICNEVMRMHYGWNSLE